MSSSGEPLRARIRVTLRVQDLVLIAKRWGKPYIRIKDFALHLGVSTRVAGKLLARLEELGILSRYSQNVFKVRFWDHELEAGGRGAGLALPLSPSTPRGHWARHPTPSRPLKER